MLNRVLNAAFATEGTLVVRFLFRLLRHLILDEEIFQRVSASASRTEVLQQFYLQFAQEFDQNVICQYPDSDPFLVVNEWPMVAIYLNQLELSSPSLRRWLRI